MGIRPRSRIYLYICLVILTKTSFGDAAPLALGMPPDLARKVIIQGT